MTRIIVTPRGGRFWACLEENHKIWGCGETADAAVGNLICAHPEVFEVKVEYKK